MRLSFSLALHTHIYHLTPPLFFLLFFRETQAMGMFISQPSMEAAALPRMKAIAAELKSRHPDVPLMAFPRGAAYANKPLGESGFDVLTLDNTAKWDTIRSELPPVCLQGAFDPSLLVRDNGGTEEGVAAEVERMLDALGPQKLIANLREGLGGKEDPALVAAFVEAVHSYKAAGSNVPDSKTGEYAPAQSIF